LTFTFNLKNAIILHDDDISRRLLMLATDIYTSSPLFPYPFIDFFFFLKWRQKNEAFLIFGFIFLNISNSFCLRKLEKLIKHSLA
jgi:hypothetical protein